MMKKLSLATKISSLLFLFFILLALFITMPLYRKLVKNVDSLTDSVCRIVTDSTNLLVSYESLSPSVLSVLSVKNISVSNQEGDVIGLIKNVKIHYRINELFKSNFTRIVRMVNVSGVEINLSSLIDYILTFDFSGQKTFEEVDIEKILDFIPSNVKVRNISLNYENELFSSLLGISEIGVMKSQKKGALDFFFDSRAEALLKDNQQKFTGKVYVNGSVMSDFENSKLFLALSDFSSGQYTVNKLNLLAEYKNRIVEVHTIQSVNPMEISASYDFENKKISASVEAQNLNPWSVVSVGGKSDLIKSLKNLRISLAANASAELDENFGLGKFAYSSNGSVKIPAAVFPGGGTASYSLSGNQDKITVSRLKMDGQNCLLDGNLDFAFKSLQLGGILTLDKYILPNKTELSCEVYIDPLEKGFELFSPQIFIGEKNLTALQAKVMPQNDSIDFELEVSDYSMNDADEPSILSFNGSYLIDSKYIQISSLLNRVYVQSAMGFAREFMPEKDREKLDKPIEFTRPYMFTGELYFSTNFDSISYYVPYLVMANTQKENQLLLVSVNGNNQTVQLDRFDLIYGKMGMNVTGGLEIESDSMNFFVDAVSSSIPYHFQGAVSSDSVKIAGDYGTDIEINFSKNKNMSGHAFLENIPFVFDKIGIIISADTGFKYSAADGPEVQIVKFTVEENDASTSSSPKLAFSGVGTKYGIQLNSLTYTDTYSSLEGFADVAVNIEQGIFDSVGANVSLKNPSLSGEQLVLDFTVSNPERTHLNLQSAMDSLYISALAEISNFSLNRFMTVKNCNNEVSATLSLSGNLSHPYAIADIKKFSFLLANEMVNANGIVTMEDSNITINDLAVKQSAWAVKNVNGNISISQMTGNINAVFETAGVKNISLPLKVVVEDSFIPEGKKIPESMMIQLSSEGLGGSLMKEALPFTITAMYTPDFISFYSTENLGLIGTYTPADGLVSQLKAENLFSAELTGRFSGNDLNINIENITADLKNVIKYFAVDEFFGIKSGNLSGNLLMAGTNDTPEFFGEIDIDNPLFTLPTVFANDLSTERIIVSASNNEIILNDSDYLIGKNKIFNMGGKVVMNKWALDNIELNLATLEKKSLPLKLTSPILNVSGDIDCNLNLQIQDKTIDLSGSVGGEKVNIVSNLNNLQNLNNSENESSSAGFSDIDFRSNLKVFLGTHVMLNFNPLLRVIFVPNTNIGLKIDSASQQYEVDGELNIKSGDVAYVNRSFYIKKGAIKFNPQMISNPQITLRAETREKDDRGQNVRIILSAENQYLLDFNPQFSSVPAKSENEIYRLLGQVAIADLNDSQDSTKTMTNFLYTAGDYALQSLVTRQIENKLRDSLNFDIFSIRANILQNALSRTDSITFSNFFDNSTVYIGKYLGSAIYVDAMLNLSLDDNITDVTDASSLLLQPELGFEFEVPFSNNNWRFIQDMDANFRLGMAWNINRNKIDPQEQAEYTAKFVPSLSMSLLWRF